MIPDNIFYTEITYCLGEQGFFEGKTCFECLSIAIGTALILRRAQK